MYINLKPNGKGEYIIMVSHSDLDGIGAVVLGLAKYRDNLNWYCCEYGNVNDRINDILTFIEDNDINPGKVLFFITDISVDRETAERLHIFFMQDMDIRLYDHHKSVSWLNAYPWAIVEMYGLHCGTTLFFEMEILPHSLTISRAYRKFVQMVKDYDLWIHEFPESKRLNRLLGLIGRDAMIERFRLRSDINLDLVETALVDADEISEDRYYKKVSKSVRIYHDLDGKRYGLALCDQYISSVGNRLVEDFKFDYVVLLDIHGGKVSLRSKGTDVAAIAEKFGGGGHTMASGFQANYDKVFDMISSEFNCEV